MKEAMFYQHGQGNEVVCRLCNHHCHIKEGKRGLCGVRENQQGKLYSLVYGRLISEHVDPIEKKPLFHFLPGSRSYSMSIDSMFVHKMWNEDELSKMVEGGIPFPMLSDAGGKVGTVYGIYDEDAGVETRGRFLIDPDGVVQGFEVLTPPVGRNVSETLRQI